MSQIGVSFITDSPDIDESAHPNETAMALVERLSKEKAKAVAARHPNALIVGSDQVATIDGLIVGKPHTHEAAVAQLRAASGQTLTFLTGLCVHNAVTDQSNTLVDTVSVTFRELTDEAIERYLLIDTPYDCAGSFKMEGLGITLFSNIQCRDPNALIGLPLIGLVGLLQDEGLAIP